MAGEVTGLKDKLKKTKKVGRVRQFRSSYLKSNPSTLSEVEREYVLKQWREADS